MLHLPGDEMKGRIIGREGRNIRAFETVTGVNVIIDDTPEAVLLSCFDPVRREIGRITLRSWSRTAGSTRTGSRRCYERSKSRGRAALPAGRPRTRWSRSASPTCTRSWSRSSGSCATAPPTGRTCSSTWSRPRTSPGMMAAELGLDVAQCKRGAFLHDIGKALTHEVEG